MTFQFETMLEFLAMGGHGAYVWSAYAISIVVLIALVVAPLRRRSKFLAANDRRRGQGGEQ
tara:strand:- start:5921 stop:6103 length:183 start_codon:yes stop_codon:yes gene_type:complete